MFVCRIALLSLVLVAVPACGGGGSEPLPGVDFPVDARPQTTGIILADATGNTPPVPALNKDGWGLVAGDGPGDLAIQAFPDFNLGGFASAGTVHRATLRMYVSNDTGDPIGNLGGLRVDSIHVGPSLDTTDYLTPSIIQFGIGTLFNQSSSGWHTIDVTTAVRTAHSLGLSSVGFRLSFPTLNDGNNQADSITFGSASTGESPQLVIRFEGLVL